MTELEIKVMKAKINKVFNLLEDRLMYLYSRWEEEKEFEDFKDYQTNIKKYIEELKEDGTVDLHNWNFERLQKHPFLLRMSYRIFDQEIIVHFKLNNSSYSWRVVDNFPLKKVEEYFSNLQKATKHWREEND